MTIEVLIAEMREAGFSTASGREANTLSSCKEYTTAFTADLRSTKNELDYYIDEEACQLNARCQPEDRIVPDYGRRNWSGRYKEPTTRRPQGLVEYKDVVMKDDEGDDGGKDEGDHEGNEEGDHENNDDESEMPGYNPA